MRVYGNATTAVGGREGVPLPAVPAKIGRRPELVDCGRGHRIRPGAFHICLDLATPEPPPPPVQKPKPKPRPTPKPQAKRGRPRVERETPTCRNGCGRTVSLPGNRCRPCADESRRTAVPKVRVGAGFGGGIGNNGGKVNAHIDEIKERYLAGEPVASIAADIGVTGSGIRIGLKRHGVTLRPAAEENRKPRPDRRALTPEQVAEAVARYGIGASIVGIAGRLGVGETTVRNALVREGVKLRGNQRGGASR